MKKVYIEEIDGEYFAYKVECVLRTSSLDRATETLRDDGYDVRVGGCLSKFE